MVTLSKVRIAQQGRVKEFLQWFRAFLYVNDFNVECCFRYHPVVVCKVVVSCVVDGHAVTSISLGVYKTVVCAPIQLKKSHKLVMARKVPLIPIYDKNRSERSR